ncbi:MAG: hypothetical protein ACRETO_07015 [Gammaproteobacteria bacterium]
MKGITQSLVMMTLVAVSGCASTGGSGMSQAVAGQAAPAPAADKVAANDAKSGKQSDLICTTSVETGSHLPQRTCITRKEKAQRQKKDLETLQTMILSGVRPHPPCDPLC